METTTWEMIATIIGAAAAVIAAASSLRNGRTLKNRAVPVQLQKRTLQKTLNDDWYQKPDV